MSSWFESVASKTVAPAKALVIAAPLAAGLCGWGSFYADPFPGTARSRTRVIDTSATAASHVGTLLATPSATPLTEVLAALRASLGATVHELAAALGVHRQSVYSWQRGEKSPSPERMRRIAQLEDATGLLINKLGDHLGFYLGYPVGPNREDFWTLLADGNEPGAVAEMVLAAAESSGRRRAALRFALREGLATEPLDRNG